MQKSLPDRRSSSSKGNGEVLDELKPAGVPGELTPSGHSASPLGFDTASRGHCDTRGRLP